MPTKTSIKAESDAHADTDTDTDMASASSRRPRSSREIGSRAGNIVMPTPTRSAPIRPSGFSPPKNVPTRRRPTHNSPVVLTAKVARPASELLADECTSENMNEKDGKTKEVLPKDATSSVRSISAVLDHEVAQKETSNKVELKGSPLGLKSQSCAAPSPVGMTTKNSKPSGNSQSKYMMTMPRTSATHSSYPPGYHPRQYGYHSGIRTSPLGYQHPSLYVSAYRQDMYHHQRQHHLQMGSPPTYSMPNGVYYPPPVQHNKTNTEPNSQRDGANSLPENDENAKPAPVKLEPTEEKPLETKTSPPIPSPPLKKRRIVGSWDEDQDRNENIGAASPGMFRSPLPGEKMQGGRNFFDFKRSPIAGGTPCRFDLNDPSFRIDTPGRDRHLDAGDFFASPLDVNGNEDEIDDDELLPGIDTSQGLAASPKIQFKDRNDDLGSSPTFNLSPIASHEFSPFPGTGISHEEDEEIDEHFPFKNYAPSPIPLKEKSPKTNRTNIPIPPLRNTIVNHQNASTPNLAPYRRQEPPYIAHPSFGQSPSFRMQMQVGGMKQMDNINNMISGHPVMQTPGKNSASVASTPSTAVRLPTYPGSSSRHATHQTYPFSAPRHHRPTLMAPSTPGKARERQTSKLPQKLQPRNPCNCKKSKCLKLYCECFAAQIYCQGCNCTDCHNTSNHEAQRAKAVKDTKAKNNAAFKPRKNKDTNVHSTGCKCKKSACLKKYCECFENNMLCAAKCKCVNCKNFAGSQALHERRQNRKDLKGGTDEAARRKEAWKKNNSAPKSGSRNPTQPFFPSSVPVMNQRHVGMPPVMSPPAYMGRPPTMMPPGRMSAYSPMPLPPGTPAYDHRITQRSFLPTPHYRTGTFQATPLLKSPKTPVGRRDPLSAKRKKMGKNVKEEVRQYFGPRNGSQNKSSAIGVMSFLSNEELYNVSIVSKAWCKLALDDELWQFE